MSYEDPIVTSTPTVCDGQVIRWHATEHAALSCNPFVSASRNGVRVDAMLAVSDVGAFRRCFDVAVEAARALRSGQDMSHLATHRHPFMSDELVLLAPRAARVPATGEEERRP